VKTFEDVLAQFGMVEVGFVPPDGAIHRFKMVGKHAKDGWAIKYPDGGGFYNCWSHADGEDGSYWHPSGKEYKDLSPESRAEADKRREELIVAREQLRINVADACAVRWEGMDDLGVLENPYLNAKKVGAFGVRNNAKGELVIPARDSNGKIWSLQTIFADGSKLWTSGGKISEMTHIIDGDGAKTILCEGYATGASIHMATGYKVVVCFDAGNMKKVAERYKNVVGVCVAADMDKEEKGGKGQRVAAEIKEKYGIPFVIPEVYGDFNDLACDGVNITDYFCETVEAYSIGEYNADNSPMPEDLIAPRILTDAGMLFFGGAPKVGKSDFMLSWLMHMAAGSEFMGMKPARPLKIFYLQAEIGYHYIRERIKMVDIDRQHIGLVERNMIVTPRLRMLLDANGVDKVGNTIRKMGDVDIIAIDPMRNLYDGESENDNTQMTAFLQGRIEALRKYAKPTTGIVVVHHTKKISKEDLAVDPFLCFSGASSLRGFYNTGMMMYRPDEDVSERVIAFEVRDGKPIDKVHVDKLQGRWFKIPKEQTRVAHEGQGRKNDAERERKIDIIKDTIDDEIEKGSFHTQRSLSEFLAGKHDLGSSRTVRTLLGEMLAQGEVNLTKRDDSDKQYLVN
jgi:phage/plasmid primase-like uncharacterized protein